MLLWIRWLWKSNISFRYFFFSNFSFQKSQMSDDTASLFDYETVKNGYSLIPKRYAGVYNVTSDESGMTHQRLITVFLIAMSVVGCLGNVLICYIIIINKHMRTTINYYLLSQAVSDSMCLLSFSYAAIFCMQLSR